MFIISPVKVAHVLLWVKRQAIERTSDINFYLYFLCFQDSFSIALLNSHFFLPARGYS